MGMSQRTLKVLSSPIKTAHFYNPMPQRKLHTNASKHSCISNDMQSYPQKNGWSQCHIYFTSQNEECISACVTCVSVESRDQEVQVKCITYSSLMTATLHLLTEEINDYHTISWPQTFIWNILFIPFTLIVCNCFPHRRLFFKDIIMGNPTSQ